MKMIPESGYLPGFEDLSQFAPLISPIRLFWPATCKIQTVYQAFYF